ncbi:MAG TPA: alpha/beta hydrolase [Nonomuraea sp.]|nr:alpha/beta hydrolase [Nonomuraea sp.]
MPYDELLSRPVRGPDRVLRYGDHSEHVIDIREGTGGPGAPVVVLLHGGFWRAEVDRAHTAPMADALAAHGYTVCTPEFRRIGHEEGGYPGTFDDVTAAVDAVLADPPSGGGVVLVGHSAGGHLALWSALRHRLPAGARRHARAPVRGVVALAAISDVAAVYAEGLGDGAARALLGGRPALLDEVDPPRLLPYDNGALVLVHGTKDRVVPVEQSRRLAAREPAAHFVELPDVGHFKLIDPLSRAWPTVLTAITTATTHPSLGGPARPSPALAHRLFPPEPARPSIRDVA